MQYCLCSCTNTPVPHYSYATVVGDVHYHAGQAYVRAGQLKYGLQQAQRAVQFYTTGGDRRRLRMALGVQALVHSLMAAPLQADGAGSAASVTSASSANNADSNTDDNANDSDITAAAASALVEKDMDLIRQACLAPADDAELEVRRARAYIQRRGPKSGGPPSAAAGE